MSDSTTDECFSQQGKCARLITEYYQAKNQEKEDEFAKIHGKRENQLPFFTVFPGRGHGGSQPKLQTDIAILLRDFSSGPGDMVGCCLAEASSS